MGTYNLLRPEYDRVDDGVDLSGEVYVMEGASVIKYVNSVVAEFETHPDDLPGTRTGIQVTANDGANGIVSLDFINATEEINISDLADKTILCGDGTRVVATGAAVVSKNNGGLKFDVSSSSSLNFSTLSGNIMVCDGANNLLEHTATGYTVHVASTSNKN